MAMPLPRLTPEDLRAAVRHMAEEARQMLALTRDAFLRPSHHLQERIGALARELHRHEKRLTDHVAMQLRECPWSLGPAQHLAFLPAGLERIGDFIEVLARCEQTLHREGLAYSEQATRDIARLFDRAAVLLETVRALLDPAPAPDLPGRLRAAGEEFQTLAEAAALGHQERVLTGTCPPRASSVFLSMLDAFREIERYTRRMAPELEKALRG